MVDLCEGKLMWIMIKEINYLKTSSTQRAHTSAKAIWSLMQEKDTSGRNIKKKSQLF